jgi:hypothetical protein
MVIGDRIRYEFVVGHASGIVDRVWKLDRRPRLVEVGGAVVRFLSARTLRCD